MASLAPGVYDKEIDVSLMTASVIGTTGGTVGNYSWGPVDTTHLVTKAVIESNLGKPTPVNATDFLTLLSFLGYTGGVYVSRLFNSAMRNAATSAGGALLIKNDKHWDSIPAPTGGFFAKYPGELGNGLRVVLADAASWAGLPTNLKALFKSIPGTSEYAGSVGAANDEIHVAVIDDLGKFTGIAGTVLEHWTYLSKAIDGKDIDGNPSYFIDVINNKSKYIRASSVLPAGIFETGGSGGGPSPVQPGSYLQNNGIGSFFANMAAVYSQVLSGGVGYQNAQASDYTTAWAKFASDKVPVNLLFVGNVPDFLVDVAKYVSENLVKQYPNRIAITSCNLNDVLNVSLSDGFDNIQAFDSALNISDSYLVKTCGWKFMYDPYNNVRRPVPMCSDVAGLIARAERNAEAWTSPAGYNHGQVVNAIDLVWDPSDGDPQKVVLGGLDTLRFNPFINTQGEGIVLMGDRTSLKKESVLSYINVRRLLNLLKAKIKDSSKYLLFDVNDEMTRSVFRNTVEPDLRMTKSKRGLIDYKVVCDESNNGPDVIDRGEFVGTIFLKPTRSIQRIMLNFVATKASINFDEVLV